MTHRFQSLGRFLRLWFLLAFSFVLLKLTLDLAVSGVIDARRAALWQLAAVPFGQSLVYWVVTRRARSSKDSPVSPS